MPSSNARRKQPTTGTAPTGNTPTGTATDHQSKKAVERLTLDQIVTAAIRLTKQQGLANLTMRTLADELGVTPMATYYYVRNKTELVDLVIEAVMSSVRVPDPSSGSWSERMWKLNRDSRKATAAHPGLADALLDRPPTLAAQSHMQAIIDCLVEAGFSPAEAQLAYTTFESCMFGRMAVERANRAPVSTDMAYRWAFDTLIAGFESRIAANRAAHHAANRAANRATD
ncbi:MAG TPA: TetR/AcrR family transcriptional regulator [Ilumatobacter sp.]|nr:TetR/AcrR family transcriptional regulator [Ilumatobacter sp.]